MLVDYETPKTIEEQLLHFHILYRSGSEILKRCPATLIDSMTNYMLSLDSNM